MSARPSIAASTLPKTSSSAIPATAPTSNRDVKKSENQRDPSSSCSSSSPSTSSSSDSDSSSTSVSSSSSSSTSSDTNSNDSSRESSESECDVSATAAPPESRPSRARIRPSPKKRARRSDGPATPSRAAAAAGQSSKQSGITERKPASSNSSSSSSSSNRRRKARKTTADNSESNPDSSSDEDDECGKQIVTSRKGQRDARTTLIARVLARWWYVLPEWPPPSVNYEEELRKRRFKVVELGDWEAADDIDETGFTKVYKLSHFEGIYRDPSGRAIDVRPLEGKPCYSTLSSKSETTLYELLVTALQNQIAAVDKSLYRTTEQSTIDKLKKELKQELSDAEEALEKLQRRKQFLEARKQRFGNGSDSPESLSSK